MDMMLLGETVRGTGDASATSYLGYWMPAGGNNGVGAVEIFLVSSANVVQVEVDTKSSDAVDPGGTASTAVTVDSTDPKIYRFPIANAKDMVRYKLTITGASDYVHFQFAQPLWLPN